MKETSMSSSIQSSHKGPYFMSSDSDDSISNIRNKAFIPKESDRIVMVSAPESDEDEEISNFPPVLGESMELDGETVAVEINNDGLVDSESDADIEAPNRSDFHDGDTPPAAVENMDFDSETVAVEANNDGVVGLERDAKRSDFDNGDSSTDTLKLLLSLKDCCPESDAESELQILDTNFEAGGSSGKRSGLDISTETEERTMQTENISIPEARKDQQPTVPASRFISSMEKNKESMAKKKMRIRAAIMRNRAANRRNPGLTRARSHGRLKLSICSDEDEEISHIPPVTVERMDIDSKNVAVEANNVEVVNLETDTEGEAESEVQILDTNPEAVEPSVRGTGLDISTQTEEAFHVPPVAVKSMDLDGENMAVEANNVVIVGTDGENTERNMQSEKISIPEASKDQQSTRKQALLEKNKEPMVEKNLTSPVNGTGSVGEDGKTDVEKQNVIESEPVDPKGKKKRFSIIDLLRQLAEEEEDHERDKELCCLTLLEVAERRRAGKF